MPTASGYGRLSRNYEKEAAELEAEDKNDLSLSGMLVSNVRTVLAKYRHCIGVAKFAKIPWSSLKLMPGERYLVLCVVGSFSGSSSRCIIINITKSGNEIMAEGDFAFPREQFPRYWNESCSGVRHLHYRGEEEAQFSTVEYGRLSAMVALSEVDVVFRQSGKSCCRCSKSAFHYGSSA